MESCPFWLFAPYPPDVCLVELDSIVVVVVLICVGVGFVVSSFAVLLLLEDASESFALSESFI